MSFLVVFNTDGAPIDVEVEDLGQGNSARRLILGTSRQTAFTWAEVPADPPKGAAAAPRNIDQRFWIIGRVRLDDREALCAELAVSPTASDEFLSLCAYTKWTERCVEHLQGDFCLAIWDEARQHLFCARDQLGVKPLFYAHTEGKWFVSDAIDNIASNVDDRVDECWIADFLTTGFCIEFDRSVYKEIKRVPPAHSLVVFASGSALRKYWTLCVETPIFYQNQQTYLEHFHSVLSASIKDRFPNGRIGVVMSGGLDSSTLAAEAVRVVGDASRVVADTRYFDHLITHDEKYFSSLVAERIGIQHRLRAVDETYYDPLWENRNITTPEPSMRIISAAAERINATEMAAQAKVWLYGEGPDNALTFEWRIYLRWLRNRRDWRHLAGALLQYLCTKPLREWRTTLMRRAESVDDFSASERISPLDGKRLRGASRR